MFIGPVGCVRSGPVPRVGVEELHKGGDGSGDVGGGGGDGGNGYDVDYDAPGDRGQLDAPSCASTRRTSTPWLTPCTRPSSRPPAPEAAPAGRSENEWSESEGGWCVCVCLVGDRRAGNFLS